MSQQQWAPYGWIPFSPPNGPTGEGQQQQQVFMLSPMVMMSPTPNMMSPPPPDLGRPHSVAYGAPPQAMYPFVNFNWQQQQLQQPDVTSQEHHVSGLLFRPDLVATSNNSSVPQPMSDSQPTYANENEQPCYINTLEPRGMRGVSMPPMIQVNEWAPKPPPRSKRSSRLGSRSSLAGSVNSIDVNELTQRLRQLENKENASAPPVRPPRRKRATKHQLKTSATLPRDFGGLHSIAEYDLGVVGAATTDNLPKPMIDHDTITKEEQKPVIPQPIGDPVVVSSTIEPAIDSIDSNNISNKPIVPMPHTSEAVPSNVPSIPQPNGQTAMQNDGNFEKAYFSVTLPMPQRQKRKESADSGFDRSRASSIHSIRDEIIDGLQKMSANVSVLKQGVVKIYEELKPVVPTYASPQKANNKDSVTPIARVSKKVEDPYETVSFIEDNTAEENRITNATLPNTEATNIDKAFRETFFGIAQPSERETESSEEDEDDEGDVTPTGEEEIVEEGDEEKVKAFEERSSRGTTALDKAEDDKDASDEEGSSTEEVGSDSETIDVSLDIDVQSTTSEKRKKDERSTAPKADNNQAEEEEEEGNDQYNELMYKAVGASWDEVEVDQSGLPPPLALHANIHSLKLDLLSSIFQGLYPTEEDCHLVRKFLSCPAGLEEKYSMVRLSDLLRKNKRSGIELEDIAEALSQLAKIGTELLRPEEERDPLWRSIPVAKEIMVTKGIATRAPWEIIQGGNDILESLGYTEYTGFALQYPRSVAPEFFADHIGNLTVELVLASVEISTLLIRQPPTLETLSILREAEAFPGNDPEVYYPEVPMLAAPDKRELVTEEHVDERNAEDDTPRGQSEKSNQRKDEGSFMTATVSLVETRQTRATSMPAHITDAVQQPGTHNNVFATTNNNNGQRRHANESDYEEIGPPPINKVASSNVVHHQQNGRSHDVCDLCGTTTAIVRCASCSEQIFCLSCDDMYHRHPRRTSHVRKALSGTNNQHPPPASSPIRPPLPPKGGEVPTPVAPPRKNLRKGSAPDSPVTPSRGHNELPLPSRSSTLPRKMGSMVGRPLPPPPPAVSELPSKPPSLNQQPAAPPLPPPPTLPNKAPNLLGSQPQQQQQQQQPQHPFYPPDHNSLRKMSTTSQPPMHLQFPGQANMMAPPGCYPMPVMNGANGQFMDARTMGRYPATEMSYPHNAVRLNNGTAPSTSGMESTSWKPSNPYLEEMEFPTAARNNGYLGESSHKRMPPSQRSKFFRLNKSSSLHDIAHEEMNGGGRIRGGGGGGAGDGNGISWGDEPWNTTQSTMNQPTLNMHELLEQQRNFRRASSTKSLHQTSEDMWAANNWAANNMTNPLMNPMMNPMMLAAMGGNQMPPAAAAAALSHQMPGSLHRSMHELHLSNRAPSPTMSQKSKKSTRSDRFLNRVNKSRRHQQQHQPDLHKPTSRPQSRTQSRGQSRKERNHRGYRESSRTRSSRRRSISTEDDMDSEEVLINDFDGIDIDDEDDDEDFFTGESDNDFVSLSSGSNSKRAPRKSWTCEHCTYVNNPGVAVCAMCCRTSKQSRGEEFIGPSNERTSSRASIGRKKKSQQTRSKYDSSEEDESSHQHSGKINGRHNNAADSRNNSLKRRGSISQQQRNRKRNTKSPMPENQLSDPDDDAINEYYAVRHIDSSHRRLDSEGRGESSSETSSMQNNPPRKPNLDAPAPAKGILKKSNSNPQLTKLEQEAKAGPPGKVVDIKKYLARGGNQEDFGNDIWQREKEEWLRHNNVVPQSRHDPMDDMSDDAASNSSTANNVGRPSMTRSISGHSLGDLEFMQQQYDEQQQQLLPNKKQSSRRTSDVSGKRNFRSKRFSRNLEREPAMRRAHSLHMDRRMLDEDGFVDIRKSMSKQTSSGSSGPEDTMHFNATVHTGASSQSEMIGSYLARQEFSGGHPEAMADSGYMSHSSGGTNQNRNSSKAPMESFTMSVDRGYLGRSPGDRDPQMHRSMDDLTFQQTKGTELVRLLREAEQCGFTAEDVQVALNHCGDANPVTWLKDNWDNMMETVVTLASNVGHEAEENTIGTLSKPEAKEALRKHKGNIWAAVTECVEQRQLKYDQLCAKGNFSREDIVTVLTANQGNVEAAFQELNKVQLKPFLMRIWGQGDSSEVASGQQQEPLTSTSSAAVQIDASLDSPITVGDDNVASVANEVTETKHNNKNAALAAFPSSIGIGGVGKEEVAEEETVSNADNDKKKNGSISEAREKYKFDREVRKLLAEGKITSYEKGEIVVKLIEQAVPEEEAFLAANKSDDLEAALDLLNQECLLCMNAMKITEVVNLPHCQHSCCRECAGKHFTIAIKDRNISEATCPFCMEPKGLADDDDLAANYFAKLDIMIKPIVEQDVHDLFQRKIRDRTLMKDPNFKWCYKCSSGFIADPRNKKLVCPDCRAMSCAKCLLPWETTHEGLSCEDFAAWKEANDPDNQAKGVEKHLQEHGIQCPGCKFRYALTKGGCMHFTCTQCKFEFCIGCERPFKMGVKCGKGPACAKMGLHAHHPRHCLFYLRDKEPTDLQRLLKNNNIEFKTEVPDEFKGQILVRCRVQVQKESADGLVDDLCNEIAPRSYAGYCKVHYTEYLCGLVFRNNVDPVSLLDLGELKQVFARANHFMPKQRPGEYEFQYKKRLAQLIASEVPLENA